MIVASIDIGTNTILMLLADIDPGTGKLRTISNHLTIPRIGKGLIPGNPISNEKIDELISIMKKFKAIAIENGASKIVATATNALRIASNATEIVEVVRKITGIEIEIIPGDQEAEYSFLGAASDCGPEEKTLVIDIGGGSTEIIFGIGKTISYKKSFNTGVVSSTEKYLIKDPPDNNELTELDNHLLSVFNELANNRIDADKTISIAGTPTTLACINLGLNVYDEDRIEGSILTRNDLTKFAQQFSGLSVNDIRVQFPEIVKGREDVILAGTLILKKILELTGVNETQVSTKGIRYGAIHYKYFKRSGI